MGRTYIVCDPELCVGCHICDLVCAGTKEGRFDLKLSRIRTVRIEPVQMLSIPCRACEEPACIKVCPRDALVRRADTGMIVVDNVKCDGCAWCVEACAFGAVVMNTTTKRVAMCDLCEGLPQPRCIEFCPKGALVLTDPDRLSNRSRERVVGRLLTEWEKEKPERRLA